MLLQRISWFSQTSEKHGYHRMKAEEQSTVFCNTVLTFFSGQDSHDLCFKSHMFMENVSKRKNLETEQQSLPLLNLASHLHHYDSLWSMLLPQTQVESISSVEFVDELRKSSWKYEFGV